jgi:hypothetical protein
MIFNQALEHVQGAWRKELDLWMTWAYRCQIGVTTAHPKQHGRFAENDKIEVLLILILKFNRGPSICTIYSSDPSERSSFLPNCATINSSF